MHSRLTKIHWLLSQQVGIDLLRCLRFFKALPWFLRDLSRFRKAYQGRLQLMPCLHDKREQSGAATSEYFVQDLFVAQRIFAATPVDHLDIGSRLDGFVAHVASFRKITVADIRPNHAQIRNVEFIQADLMRPLPELLDRFDSVSCLHTLEHFGLGRYGDPIDTMGYVSGLANICKLVKPAGRLYLSAPVGIERVEFNANRVFDPRTLLQCARDNGMQPASIVFITSGGAQQPWDGTEAHLQQAAATPYLLGVFEFDKRCP